MMNIARARQLLQGGSSDFWSEVGSLAAATEDASDLLLLAGLRRKAALLPTVGEEPVRIAFLGGYSLHLLAQMVTARLGGHGMALTFFEGGFDNYVSEISEGSDTLMAFRPEVVLLAPSHLRCRYQGSINDPVEQQRESASRTARDILDLCTSLNERSGAEVLLANFPLPSRHDFGAFRTRTLATDWGYRKLVNLELGLAAPSCVRICDVEFLAARMGGTAAQDERAWFESKQMGSAALLGAMAAEIGRLVAGLRRPMRKVLALDLDNTLWGGVVGDDGVEGIEVGDTSPRGEAFKAFQRYVKSLKERGVLLAVCSKNGEDQASAPFVQHPEMVLRMEDFVAFKANWEPKSDNLRAIASQLNLGLDSFVFVDDNPAEIDIVRQFAPEVATLLLGPDPATYVAQVQDAHFFEPQWITKEDSLRSDQYRSDSLRSQAAGAATDMNSYLASLEMQATICEFVPIDFPRIAQLIARSNQFNLTTRRRTLAEVAAIASDPGHAAFIVRLSDRFGDHGLISVVVATWQADTFVIDTWLMSCRVLKRQVEEIVVNEMVRLAKERGCARLRGRYLPSSKNGMVKDLLPRMGFQPSEDRSEVSTFDLETKDFHPFSTSIKVLRHAYESGQHS